MEGLWAALLLLQTQRLLKDELCVYGGALPAASRAPPVLQPSQWG